MRLKILQPSPNNFGVKTALFRKAKNLPIDRDNCRENPLVSNHNHRWHKKPH